jgi:hypothetical protein
MNKYAIAILVLAGCASRPASVTVPTKHTVQTCTVTCTPPINYDEHAPPLPAAVCETVCR